MRVRVEVISKKACYLAVQTKITKLLSFIGLQLADSFLAGWACLAAAQYKASKLDRIRFSVNHRGRHGAVEGEDCNIDTFSKETACRRGHRQLRPLPEFSFRRQPQPSNQWTRVAHLANPHRVRPARLQPLQPPTISFRPPGHRSSRSRQRNGHFALPCPDPRQSRRRRGAEVGATASSGGEAAGQKLPAGDGGGDLEAELRPWLPWLQRPWRRRTQRRGEEEAGRRGGRSSSSPRSRSGSRREQQGREGAGDRFRFFRRWLTFVGLFSLLTLRRAIFLYVD